MAIYHLSAQIIKRSAGRSAVAAAAYRAAEKMTDTRTGKVADFTRKRGVASTHILLPADAPVEFADRSTLWNAVERAETRKNSQVAREIDIALPVELNPQQQRDLILWFVQSTFVDAGMVADVAIHDIYSPNPHAHVMLTTRNVDSSGFTTKNRSWNDKKLLKFWREQWAEHANSTLERADSPERIDHRTLEAQGITDRAPQVHLGTARHAMQRRGVNTDTVALQQEHQSLKRAAQEAAAAKIAEAETQAQVDFLAAQLDDVQAQRRQNNDNRISATRARISAVRAEFAAAEQRERDIRERVERTTADTGRGEEAVQRLKEQRAELREEKSRLESELERARAIAAAVTRAATRALGAVTSGISQWRDRRLTQRRAEQLAKELAEQLEREKERHGKAEKEVEELESWSREASVSLGRLTEQLAAEESRHAELRADCERLEKMAATPDQRRAIKDLAEVIRAARARSGVIMSSAEALATAKERYEQRHTRTVHRPAPTPAPRDFDAPKG